VFLSSSPPDRVHNDRYHPILPDACYIPMSIAQLVGDIRKLNFLGSSGRCELYRSIQVLRWWHSGTGEQTLMVQRAGASPTWPALHLDIY